MPKKSLGQHFLRSQKTLGTIVRHANITPNMLVLEVGPGEGVLTSALLQAGARVIAIEKDDSLIAHLHKKFAHEVERGMLNIVHEDVLECDIAQYTHGEPYALIANIPYYITGAILRKFLSGNTKPHHAVLLVQKEVAERIARDTKESILSLSVKVYGTPQYVETVKAGSFSPPPKVDSAILSITDIKQNVFPSTHHEQLFFELIKTSFSGKRKQIQNTLSKHIEKEALFALLSQYSLVRTIRPEDVPLHFWLALVEELSRK